MFILLTSFISGFLTILTPCVLPVLPVILGSSLEKAGHKKVVIIASLVCSIIIFTLLLKFSAAFLNFSPSLWTNISGGLVIFLGLTYIFPKLWEKFFVSSWIKRGGESINKIKNGKQEHNSENTKNVLTGLALGPIFTSCSPTYFLILAVVLPVNFYLGFLYLVAYSFGLGLALFLISVFGEKILEKINKNLVENMKFKILIGVLFVIVGVFIISGIDKKIESKIAQPEIVKNIEINLLENKNLLKEKSELLKLSELNQKTKVKAEKKEEVMKFDNLGVAKELSGIVGYLNVADNTTLKSILEKNKIVMLEFWTYTCINCKRTLPYVNDWYSKYHDKGFEIVGVHTPEFAFEKVKENVEKNAAMLGVKFPIFMDNDYATWNAYNNHYWPMRILILPSGQIIYQHAGEGDYKKNEEIIKYFVEQN